MSTIVRTATTLMGQTKLGWVECEIAKGIGIHVVGHMDDVEVREMLLRVVTALQTNGYSLPGKKIVIQVSREPGTEKKKHGRVGGWFDLPIALAILIESGQIQAEKSELNENIFVGALGLDGKVRPCDGGLSHPLDAARVIAWQYKDNFSVWGWDADCKGGKNWLDVESLKDCIELLEAHSEEGCRV